MYGRHLTLKTTDNDPKDPAGPLEGNIVPNLSSSACQKLVVNTTLRNKEEKQGNFETLT